MSENPFAFLLPSPDDLKRIHDRHEMLVADMRNRIENAIDSLAPETLAIFRDMFQRASTEPLYAAYMEGVLSTTLKLKHPERCESCGEMAHHRMDNPHEAVDDLFPPAPEEEKDEEALVTKDGVVNESMAAGNPVSNMIENMKIWEVELVDQRRPSGMVRCINCGTISSSLEDRMLRDPGVKGCGVCQHKAKFG